MSMDSSHSHCETCFRTKCHKNACCPIISCSLRCGALFHSCKESDHHLLCPLEKVSCINAGNGCPRVLYRRDIGQHLTTCPASVTCCTMEWCRWPMYSRDRQVHVPFTPKNLHARCKQLDCAMALRDQRTLAEARKFPHRSVIRSLRTSYTPRYPAVPIVVGGKPAFNRKQLDCQEPVEGASDDEVENDDDHSAPWLMSKEPPGLQRSICTELFCDLSPRLENSLCPDESHITCVLCNRKTVNAEHENVSNCVEARSKQSSGLDDDSYCLGRSTSVLNIALTSAGGSDFQHTSSVLASSAGCEVKPRDGSSLDAICSDSHTPVNTVPAPPVTSLPLALHQVIAVDLNVEHYSRYALRPAAIYSFICASLMRRDQYASHVLHIHSDIQDLMSDWLEVRCPLAHCGCTFSVRRIQPANGELVFNTVLESFGVRRDAGIAGCQHSSPAHCLTINSNLTHKEQTPEMCTSTDFDSNISILPRVIEDADLSQDDCLQLSSLPKELLCHIASFLDSFSLCNFSLTCWLLRNICYGLLKHRGIVVQDWERVAVEGKVSWKIYRKRWLFSKACDPIRRWQHFQHCSISDHLKLCPFNTPASWPAERIPLTQMTGNGSMFFDEKQKRKKKNHPVTSKYEFDVIW